MNLPTSTEPTIASAFCTCSRLCAGNWSSCCGVSPNSALMAGTSRESRAASTAQSSPGTGTALAAAPTRARRFSSLRLRRTASIRIGLPSASCRAVSMSCSWGVAGCASRAPNAAVSIASMSPDSASQRSSSACSSRSRLSGAGRARPVRPAAAAPARRASSAAFSAWSSAMLPFRLLQFALERLGRARPVAGAAAHRACAVPAA